MRYMGVGRLYVGIGWVKSRRNSDPSGAGGCVVHAMRPARSKVVVKLGARRASSLTQLCGRDTHALCGPCVIRYMCDVVHGCGPTLCWDRLGLIVGTQWAGG